MNSNLISRYEKKVSIKKNFLRPVRYLCSHSIDQPTTVGVDMEFILPYETVVEQQDYISGKINAPTTIIQFRKDIKNEWERIDSWVSAISLRTSCDLLRRCIDNKGELCRKCDAEHAELFYQMTDDQLTNEEFKMKINNKQEAWDKTYNNSYHNLSINKEYKHIFLSYNCPMFGYRELMFPIFFEKMVVAVFFVGQIKLDGEENIIKLNKENFFWQNPDIFNAYLESCKESDDYKNNPGKYTSEAIQDYIINKSIRENKTYYPEIYEIKQGMQIPDVKDKLTLVQYEEMVKEICEWLDRLEKLLIKEMKQKRQNHVRNVITEALFNFHSDSTNVEDPHSIQETVWIPVRRFSKRISEQCALEYMIVYSMRSVDRKVVSNLRIVALSSNDLDRSTLALFSLDELLKHSLMDKPSDSRVSPYLFSALELLSPDEQERMSIIFHPMKEIPAASVAILIKYPNDVLKDSIEEVLISGLQTLVALISSRLAVRYENAAQTLLQETLRLYKHEIVNLSSDVSRGIKILGKLLMKEDIALQKAEDVYRDAMSSLDMFQFLSKNISMLVNEPFPRDIKRVRIYNDLIYKWENTKRLDARDKGCDIEYRKSHVEFYTNQYYAEIVVYNLLTNAVKYAYNNTMIYIHCMKSSQDCYILSVTNFTFNLKKNERYNIFRRGYRTPNARAYYPEGSGRGLWLVREVMRILGGKVRLCKTEWISGYNIPLLYEYVNNPHSYVDTNMDLFEAKKEYNRLLSEDIINDFG
jgi:hypothetical protein